MNFIPFIFVYPIVSCICWNELHEMHSMACVLYYFCMIRLRHRDVKMFFKMESNSDSDAQESDCGWDHEPEDHLNASAIPYDDDTPSEADSDICFYCQENSNDAGTLSMVCCRSVCSSCMDDYGSPLCNCKEDIVSNHSAEDSEDEISSATEYVVAGDVSADVILDGVDSDANSSDEDQGSVSDNSSDDDLDGFDAANIFIDGDVESDQESYEDSSSSKSVEEILEVATARDKRMFLNVHRDAQKHSSQCFTPEMKNRVALDRNFKCCDAKGRRYECKKRQRKVVADPHILSDAMVANIKDLVSKGLRLLPSCTQQNHCVANPKRESVVLDVYAKVSAWVQRSDKEKRTWLGTILSFVGHMEDQNAIFTTGAPLNMSLCKQCFCAYNGIGSSTYYRRKNDVKHGRVNWDHGGSGRKKGRIRGGAMQWLALYAKKCGDFMPHKEGEIHLPDYYWAHVYSKMTAELGKEEGWGGIISNARFRALGKKEMSWIKIRKYKMFAKCTTCSKLDDRIERSFGATKLYWKEKKDKHIKWQMQEREKYYKHRTKSRDLEGSKKCVAMSIDSMDHSKTALPSKARDDKETEHAAKLHTHLTGVLVHGLKTEALCYTWHDRFPAASDVVMTIVLDTLQKITKSRGKLPPTCYIHLDNCWRENKNSLYLFVL